MSQASVIERLEAVEKAVAKVTEAFLEHWKWHRGEEKRLLEVAVQFHEELGVTFALANNRADACRGAFVAGPTTDLKALRDVPSEDGCILVMFQAGLLENKPECSIVSQYRYGRWWDQRPAEKLP